MGEIFWALVSVGILCFIFGSLGTLVTYNELMIEIHNAWDVIKLLFAPTVSLAWQKCWGVYSLIFFALVDLAFLPIRIVLVPIDLVIIL